MNKKELVLHFIQDALAHNPKLYLITQYVVRSMFTNVLTKMKLFIIHRVQGANDTTI